MSEIFAKILPLIFLILLGVILRKKDFFGENGLSMLQSVVLYIALPCVLFSAFVDIDIETEYLWASVAFFVFNVVVLGVGFLITPLLPYRRKFTALFFGSYGFGTLAIPFYTTFYGVENLKYLSVLGVGHELFIALIYLPLAQTILENKPVTAKRLLGSLKSPFLLMTAMGLLVRFSAAHDIVMNSVIGMGIVDTIERLGNLSLTLALIMIGYRLKFSGKSNLRESAVYVLARNILTLVIGGLFKIFIIDHIVAPTPLFDAAYIILLIQHSSISLTVIVGENCSREDHETVSNTLVLNIITGLALVLLYPIVFLS